MGQWSSDGYSYTEGQIGSTAYANGCGNGWFWIHKKPNMFLQGSIANDGSYSLRFYKPNSSLFGFTLRIEVNGTTLWSYSITGLNNKEVLSDVKNGNVGAADKVTVRLFCGADSCDVGANAPGGKIILDVTLDKTKYPVKIRVNGEWKDAMMYVFKDGSWHETEPYIYKDGSWHEPAQK